MSIIIDLTIEVIDITGDESTDESIDDECCICYSSLSTSKKIELPCGHVFHDKCIREWSKKKMNCPLDRKSFRVSDLESNKRKQKKRKRNDECDEECDLYRQHLDNVVAIVRGQISERQEQVIERVRARSVRIN